MGKLKLATRREFLSRLGFAIGGLATMEATGRGLTEEAQELVLQPERMELRRLIEEKLAELK